MMSSSFIRAVLINDIPRVFEIMNDRFVTISQESFHNAISIARYKGFNDLVSVIEKKNN
jgi:hypothetical protein